MLRLSFLNHLKSTCLLLSLLTCFYCQQHTELTSIKGQALGTNYQIKYASPLITYSEINHVLDSIFSIVNHSMSTYDSSSLISKINSEQTTIEIDPHFEKVFRVSQKIWKKTNGYFDPTVGPLVNAYGFGPKGIQKINHHDIDSLKQHVGLDQVTLENGVLTKQHPKISLDFNAIAKGYTVDLIGQFLKEQQIEDFLIELGGEILASGTHPQTKNKWSIGIENPLLDSVPRILKVVELKNKAHATSGNYRKFWLDSLGKKYVHTINPLTGRVQNSNVLSVSVIAKTCIQADAMATALLAMPLDQGRKLIENEKDFEALFIVSNNKELEVYTSGGFQVKNEVYGTY